MNKKALLGLIGIALVVPICGYFFFTPSKMPEKIIASQTSDQDKVILPVKQFVNASAAGHWDKAIQYLSGEAKANALANNKNKKRRITKENYKLVFHNQTGNFVVVDSDITYSGAGRFFYRYYLYEGKIYYVEPTQPVFDKIIPAEPLPPAVTSVVKKYLNLVAEKNYQESSTLLTGQALGQALVNASESETKKLDLKVSDIQFENLGGKNNIFFIAATYQVINKTFNISLTMKTIFQVVEVENGWKISSIQIAAQESSKGVEGNVEEK